MLLLRSHDATTGAHNLDSTAKGNSGCGVVFWIALEILTSLSDVFSPVNDLWIQTQGPEISASNPEKGVFGNQADLYGLLVDANTSSQISGLTLFIKPGK